MMTSRRGFLAAVGGAAAVSLVSSTRVWGQDKSAPTNAAKAVGAPAALEVVEIEKDLRVIMGAGGNIAVHTSPESALVVDAGIPERAADVAAAVAKLAGDAPQKTLVNTHYHFDHVGGNGEMAKAGYLLVGSANCRKRLGERLVLEDFGMTMEPVAEGSRTMVAFENFLTLYAAGGSSEVKLKTVAPAHTDTDITVWFSKYGVLHTGDLFFNGMFPVIDRGTGGSLDGYMAATEMMLRMVDGTTRIIPGHGPLAKKGDLEGQLALLKQVKEILTPYGEKRTPMAEVLEKAPLAGLDDKWGRGYLRSPTFTKMAYGQWLTR